MQKIRKCDKEIFYSLHFIAQYKYGGRTHECDPTFLPVQFIFVGADPCVSPKYTILVKMIIYSYKISCLNILQGRTVFARKFIVVNKNPDKKFSYQDCVCLI